MSCSRCQGLMVAENLFNPSEGLSHTWVPVTRCLNCGNLEGFVDPTGATPPRATSAKRSSWSATKRYMDSHVMEAGARLAA
jgi:hypothetical protein